MFVTHALFKKDQGSQWVKCILIGKDELLAPSVIIYDDGHGNPLVLDSQPWDYKVKHYEGCANFNV